MSQVELNREIKTVCMYAKINQPVTTTIVKGGKQVKTTSPKYMLISSHCGRRSAATQMALSGVPERSVMLITGHKRTTSLESYIRLTKEENAVALKNVSIFKK